MSCWAEFWLSFFFLFSCLDTELEGTGVGEEKYRYVEKHHILAGEVQWIIYWQMGYRLHVDCSVSHGSFMYNFIKLFLHFTIQSLIFKLTSKFTSRIILTVTLMEWRRDHLVLVKTHWLVLSYLIAQYLMLLSNSLITFRELKNYDCFGVLLRHFWNLIIYRNMIYQNLFYNNFVFIYKVQY